MEEKRGSFRNKALKPEQLKHGLAGYWSRRIDTEHRIVYQYQSDSILID